MIRLGAVGDVVRTLPAVSRLRAAHPGAHLAWLVEPAASSAVRGQPGIDEVIVFPRDALVSTLRGRAPARGARAVLRFTRALRRRRFDLVVDFHAILRSALLARLSGASRRVSYARPFGRELAWLLSTHRARLARRHISRFERNAGLVEYLGGKPVPLATVPFRVDPATRARFEAALGAGPTPAALHPGTSDATPHKRYAPHAFARVARDLAAAGVPSIVTYGPARGEREVAGAVVEASAGAARLAPATGSLAELAALLSACRLYVGSDTGPLHVASLVGTPVVQILGPTDPVENAPYSGTPFRTVRVPVSCSPCRRGCAAATCMRAVPPELVSAAARQLLAEAEAMRPTTRIAR